MILSDKSIKDWVDHQPTLIEGFDPKMLGKCGYTLRVGTVILPKTGETHDFRKVPAPWILEPGCVVYIVTHESLNIPHNICASFEAVNRLAKKGIILMNSSFIEPLYRGPLSGLLINISNSSFPIWESDAIGKVIFQQLDHVPENGQPLVLPWDNYRQDVARDACLSHRTFLNLEEIEKNAAKKAKEEINQATKIAGIFLAAIVFFASIEPLISKWLYEKTGITTTTKLVQEEDQHYERVVKALEEENKLDAERITKLEKMVDELKLMESQQPVKTPTNAPKTAPTGP